MSIIDDDDTFFPPSPDCIPFIFIRTNFDAFHSLFAKFEADSSFSGMYLMSFPGVIPIINDKRNASVPYLSIISSGSIPFPKLLDIFLP